MSSEEHFLSELFPLFGKDETLVVPPGDDCAVYAVPGSDLLQIVALDQVIENRHYTPETPARAVGRKLLARNLSDIAAMGGVPRYALISSASSMNTTEEWLKEFHLGIIELAREHGVFIIGGDIAKTPQDSVASLTIIGEQKREEILSQKNISPKDFLCATGEFGNSFLSEHHLHFSPRLEEGRFLTLGQWAKAATDVSDGLLQDAAKLCRQNKLGLTLFTDLVPLRDGAVLPQAFTDGEDYELLFAVAPDKISALEKAWPFENTRFSVIGQFCKTTGLHDEAGQDLTQYTNSGFDHLR